MLRQTESSFEVLLNRHSYSNAQSASHLNTQADSLLSVLYKNPLRGKCRQQRSAFEFHGWAVQGCSCLKSCGRPVPRRHRTERNPQGTPPLWETAHCASSPSRKTECSPPAVSWRQKDTLFQALCRSDGPYSRTCSRCGFANGSLWVPQSCGQPLFPWTCPSSIGAFPAGNLLLLQNPVVYFQKILYHSSWPGSFPFVSVGTNILDCSMAFFYPILRPLLYTIA